jgi:hypothetical protein
VGQECCKKKEKCIYNTIINSVTPYGCEVWQIKKNTRFGNGFLAQFSKNIQKTTG